MTRNDYERLAQTLGSILKESKDLDLHRGVLFTTLKIVQSLEDFSNFNRRRFEERLMQVNS